MSVTYPEPELMWIRIPATGIETEGRKNRTGFGSMKIGASSSRWEVDQVTERSFSTPELPGIALSEFTYIVNIRSFVPLYLLGPIKRYETISNWKCSYQEILRHLANAAIFTGHSYWPAIKELLSTHRESICQLLIDWHNLILQKGDYSPGQWAYYVTEHGDSATPFANIPRWRDINDNPRLSGVVKSVTDKWIPKFIEAVCNEKELMREELRLVRAEYTYPGIRARPANYQILSQDDYNVKVFCSKWRDRKVGGVKGASQITYPMYQGMGHMLQSLLIQSWMNKITKMKARSFTVEGPQMYLDLAKDSSKWHCYDLKTAEKLTGLLLDFAGYAVDLSDARFPAEHAPELYSGVGPTPFMNEITIALVLMALNDLAGAGVSEFCYFSDNVVTNAELPDNPYLDKTPTFCGFIPKEERFGPASLCTDNPKHRIGFNGKHQLQVQRVQYIMRPFLSVVLNSTLVPTSCRRFLEYITSKKLLEHTRMDNYRKDVIKEGILGLDKEVHENILASFPEEAERVKTFYFTQDKDPAFVSDLMVYS